MSKGNQTARIAAFEEPLTVDFHFREKGKIQPTGYEGLGIDQEVTVTVKGKVKQIGSSYDKGPRFTIEPSACEITVAASKPGSLSTAVEDAAKTRKKVK